MLPFFSHELRVALWYILEEEFPPAQPHWMGGEMGGEGQRLLEEAVRKEQLNKLHLASGPTVSEMLRTFVIMLAKPRELVVLLETMTAVLLTSGRRLGLGDTERVERVNALKLRILRKLDEFGIAMMFTDGNHLVAKTTDTGAVTLARLPRSDDLVARLDPLVKSVPVVSLVFLDVDGLKAINDRIGHDAGTASLARLVETISPIVVGRGMIFRYGGDEFVVVLPNFDLREAAATAERLRRGIENAHIGDPRLTASIGVASSADEGAAVDLIHKADEAAYVSKFAGKNRVTSWPLDDELARRIADVRQAAQGR